MNRPKKGRPDGPPLIFANDGWVNFSAFVAPSRQHQVEVTEVRLAVTVHVATVRSEPTGQNDAEIAEAHLSVAAQVGWARGFIRQDPESQGSRPLIIGSGGVSVGQTNGPIARA